MTPFFLNTIYRMDVLDYLNILPDSSIDLAIIDPPYNLKIARWDEFSSEKAFLDFTYAWIEAMLPKLKPTASFYLFNTPYNCALIVNYLRAKPVHFQNWITWYKKDGMSTSKKRYVNNQESILFYTVSTEQYHFDSDSIRVPYLSTDRIAAAAKKGILKNGKRWFPNPNGRLCPDVWEIVSERHKEKVNGKVQKLNHPTPKPTEMIQRMLLASSAEGDVVLDLFSGRGTTSLCAQAMHRIYTGCEINDYTDNALNIFSNEPRVQR